MVALSTNRQASIHDVHSINISTQVLTNSKAIHADDPIRLPYVGKESQAHTTSASSEPAAKRGRKAASS